MTFIELAVVVLLLMIVGAAIDFWIFKDTYKQPLFLSVFTILALLLSALMINGGFIDISVFDTQ